jgi:aldo/keto reductase family protein
MTLPTHPLGKSGLNITRAGFGSWAVGGGGWSFGWGPQDDAQSIATMHRALDLGINWIDTGVTGPNGIRQQKARPPRFPPAWRCEDLASSADSAHCTA